MWGDLPVIAAVLPTRGSGIFMFMSMSWVKRHCSHCWSCEPIVFVQRHLSFESPHACFFDTHKEQLDQRGVRFKWRKERTRMDEFAVLH